MELTFFDIEVKSIEGGLMDLNQFRNKKILIVNVASECGLTPQYAQLEELYQKHMDELVIIGCPCNDFGNQEPGDNAEVLDFCTKRYGVTFPLTEKLTILNDPHPLYQWLTKKEFNKVDDFNVKWNFHKFLIEGDGTFYKSLPSLTDPLSDEILGWISAT
ncbi:MAG: glutathione peroxidase [Saprospiraceae bacterium]|nr:glutathione peroxidase [Saprospiraceae bacterium]